MNSTELKNLVKEKYNEISQAAKGSPSSCCGTSLCCADGATMADGYENAEGYFPDADLGLGCGLPVDHAKIKKGDTVVDLGSGAGNDCFVARNETGDTGKVIGIDMTDSMIALAKTNTGKLGYKNVEFRHGDIEDLPLADKTADVVISNCVLNLVPDKEKAFSEIFRILKEGGHFSVSDIVLRGNLPDALKNDAEMYAGCISGAVDADRYFEMIKAAGFKELTVQKEKKINLPAELLARYGVDADQYNNENTGIYSVTVYAEKPSASCCNKETCCN